MVELWQNIEFKIGEHILIYQVRSSFLYNAAKGDGHTNAEIFHQLGIEDPTAFATKVYGYPSQQPNKGSFPEYRENDLAAATAIVEALKEECAKANHNVKWGDMVYFRVGDHTLAYRVTSTHLTCDYDSNNIIFEELELDKYAVCTQCYGYDAGYGSFPTCQYEDFEALTRLIDYLQQKCMEYNAKYDMPEDFKAKPGKTAPEYTWLEKAIDAMKSPTPSLLSETTLLTRRKSNTCKF